MKKWRECAAQELHQLQTHLYTTLMAATLYTQRPDDWLANWTHDYIKE